MSEQEKKIAIKKFVDEWVTNFTIENFLTRTIEDKETGCLVWQGRTNNGYPCYTQKRIKIQRLLMNASKNQYIKTTCKNKKCLNKEHLYIATKKEKTMENETKWFKQEIQIQGRNVDVWSTSPLSIKLFPPTETTEPYEIKEFTVYEVVIDEDEIK